MDTEDIRKTFGPDLFIALSKPIAEGRARMTRRSSSDKEYFVQDWIESQLEGKYQITKQGRNSHPDYILSSGDQAEGLEVKSLENQRGDNRDPSRVPCRSDVDFNSCVPCGLIKLKDKKLRCYYAFVLYESDPISDLHVSGIALALVDGNFLNRDFDLAAGHLNISKGGFGSYGDAFIRTRKMYRFPNPLTIPQFRYKNVFVTESTFPSPGKFGLKPLDPVEKIDKAGRSYRFNVYTLY